MPKQSAGLLLFKKDDTGLQVLLVHPGGPFWRNKDKGSWTIPKGEFTGEEDPLAAAKREFEEETGGPPPQGDYIPLKAIKQKNGKTVHVWAVAGDFDSANLISNTFLLEWPPKSGRKKEFPEVDRAAWFDPETAKQKMLSGQPNLIDQLLAILARVSI